MNSQNVHSVHSVHNVQSGVSLEESALTADELARACSVQTEWVIDHVQAGLLVGISVTSVTSVTTVIPVTPEASVPPPEMRFTSPELVRARRLLALERNFDANPELAALAVDLIEEVEHLRRRLQAATVSRWPLQSP